MARAGHAERQDDERKRGLSGECCRAIKLLPYSKLKGSTMTTTISRLYNSQMEARTAVHDLEAAGLKNGDISIVASNADNWYDAKTKTDHDLDGKDDRAEGAATGGGIGAAAGGAAGLLAGLGLIAIPGVGPVVAAGWLVATLTGALAGGATGVVIGALTQHAGLSKEDVRGPAAWRRGCKCPRG